MLACSLTRDTLLAPKERLRFLSVLPCKLMGRDSLNKSDTQAASATAKSEL